MKYQSFARVTKTYHGVTFEPGEIKEVNGYINDSRFVRIQDKPKKDKKQESNDVPQQRRKNLSIDVSPDKDVEVKSTSTEDKADNKQTRTYNKNVQDKKVADNTATQDDKSSKNESVKQNQEVK